MEITSKVQFDNISSTLCGRMVSLESEIRKQAANEAADILESLPKFLLNSPHCSSEIEAMNSLIARVKAEIE